MHNVWTFSPLARTLKRRALHFTVGSGIRGSHLLNVLEGDDASPVVVRSGKLSVTALRRTVTWRLGRSLGYSKQDLERTKDMDRLRLMGHDRPL